MKTPTQIAKEIWLAYRRKTSDEPMPQQAAKELMTAVASAIRDDRKSLAELIEVCLELHDALVGQGSAGAIDGDRVDSAHAALGDIIVRLKPRDASISYESS